MHLLRRGSRASQLRPARPRRAQGADVSPQRVAGLSVFSRGVALLAVLPEAGHADGASVRAAGCERRTSGGRWPGAPRSPGARPRDPGTGWARGGSPLPSTVTVLRCAPLAQGKVHVQSSNFGFCGIGVSPL